MWTDITMPESRSLFPCGEGFREKTEVDEVLPCLRSGLEAGRDDLVVKSLATQARQLEFASPELCKCQVGVGAHQ